MLFGGAVVTALVLAPAVLAMRASSAAVLREAEHEEAFWRTRRGAPYSFEACGDEVVLVFGSSRQAMDLK